MKSLNMTHFFWLFKFCNFFKRLWIVQLPPAVSADDDDDYCDDDPRRVHACESSAHYYTDIMHYSEAEVE